MRLLVTGGTGYVGSHAVAALVRAGHEVRLLVRSPDRIARALVPLGIDAIACERGDVTDAASVTRAIQGCDGVVHAASMYSLDVRDVRAMERINAPGTELVLGEAARRGLDPIVYVSSTAAFLPGDGSVVGPDSPVGEPAFAYARSKSAAERVARAHQERGDPVGVVYPGMVWGPCDPYLGETLQLARNLLKRRLPVLPRGGSHVVDVRDVAATIVALCEAGRGARRHVVPGRYAAIPRLTAELAAVTGRRLPFVSLPPRALLPAARAADLVQRLTPARLPISAEALYFITCDLRVDDAGARRELGISPRPVAATLADSVRWLYEQGHIRARAAGAAAVSDGPSRDPGDAAHDSVPAGSA